jgi:hypothetical protein
MNATIMALNREGGGDVFVYNNKKESNALLYCLVVGSLDIESGKARAFYLPWSLPSVSSGHQNSMEPNCCEKVTSFRGEVKPLAPCRKIFVHVKIP